MTPPPTIVIELGSSVEERASVLFITKGRPIPGILILDILDPVAIITSLNSILVLLSPLTITDLLDRKEASPLRTWILFFFIRNSTPPTSLSLTSSFRLITFSISTLRSPSQITPNSSLFLIVWHTSADLTKALVGIQPTLRQVPPKVSFSTKVTFSPCLAPYMAAI